MDLLHAAEAGRLTVVKQLTSEDKSLIHTCRHKDKRNRAFNIGGSAIHYACRSGHLNVVKYLLEQDATIINDLDIEHWTPLHYACSNGHLNIVKLLVEHNAKIDIKDTYLSQTPIQFAMYKQFEDIVSFLDPNIEWKRRDENEIYEKGNVAVFRRNSELFLGRYTIGEDHIKQIELFRNDPHSTDLELNHIQDMELDHLQVRIRLKHDFKQHIKKTIELLSSSEEDDTFLRSSTTSTNEHVLVLHDQ